MARPSRQTRGYDAIVGGCVDLIPYAQLKILQNNCNANSTMMTSARDIAPSPNGYSLEVTNSLSLSTSPIATFHSPQHASYGGAHLTRRSTGAYAKQLKPFATEDIKILLLENVNQTGRESLEKQGYQVEFYKTSLSEDDLIAKIRWGTPPPFLDPRDENSMLMDRAEMCT